MPAIPWVFRGRRGDPIEPIRHDGDGACLFVKRLERGRFLWPSVADGVATISAAPLSDPLSAMDWRTPQKTWRPTAAGRLRPIDSRVRFHGRGLPPKRQAEEEAKAEIAASETAKAQRRRPQRGPRKLPESLPVERVVEPAPMRLRQVRRRAAHV